MIKKRIYQTLKNKGNPDIIESEGPFACFRTDAWLGDGFYFWDTFIELAHRWGKVGCNNDYFICEAECDFNSIQCWDLIQSESLLELEECLQLMEEKGIFSQNEPDRTNITVPTIINYLKKIGQFPYEAIRAHAPNTISIQDEDFKDFKIRFNPSKKQYLDTRPAYQICFLTKKSLNLRNYRLIYPEIYEANYTI